jgi:hypothetical protein
MRRGSGREATGLICQTRQGKSSLVRSSRERTLGPIPVLRPSGRAAFPGTIQGMKGQNGHSIGRGLTYGGLGGLRGALLGAQQPFWSYQNSLDLQSELPAITDGMITARRAKETRKREIRGILKGQEWAKERLEPLMGGPFLVLWLYRAWLARHRGGTSGGTVSTDRVERLSGLHRAIGMMIDPREPLPSPSLVLTRV